MAGCAGRKAGGLVARLMPKAPEEQMACSAWSFWASKHQEQGQGGRQEGRGSWGSAGLGLLGAGLVGLAASSSVLSAEEKKVVKPEKKKSEKLVFGKTPEDRIRQYATADNVFDHFASYQLVSETGKKTTMMSTRNFYNAMTPGSHLGEEVGLGKSAYKMIDKSELFSNFVRQKGKLPVHGSNFLNAINEHGLLTFSDYHFLLLLMSTPTRYLDMIFHGFDISADGSVEAKEFVYVLARIANMKVDPEELMKRANNSGLVRYLFGDDLQGSLTKQDFVRLQAALIRDVLEMEFTRYAEDTTAKMTEIDFSRHLLYSSSISQKRKEKMIKRVAEEFKGENAKGISFDSFLTFYNVLFGGADLERAMFFLDEEHFGVTRDEFIKVANWVVGVEVDPHVVEVVYCLLDEDGDRNLSTKEFNPVLFSWRHSRGFQNGALSVTLGNMKF